MSGIALNPNEKDLQKIVTAINQVLQGRSNNTGTVTLTANATTTTVSAPNCGSGSTPVLTPMSSNAATAATTMYVSAVANGSFTITHANNSQTDRTFSYSFHG